MPGATSMSGLEFEGIHLTQSDFTTGKDEGATVDSGVVAEVATTEIGEDGQLSSYDALRLGDNLDATGMSPKGKLFVELRDSADEPVDERTQVRWVARDKNSNRRIPITRWYAHRDLNKDDTRQRTPLQPVTRNNSPFFVKSGRLVTVEVKNQAEDVEVDLSNSTFEVPSRAGY